MQTSKILNQVFNEDCKITMSKIKDKSINLIIADFPYFEVKGDFDFIWKDFAEFLLWVEECAKEFKRILADNGSLYVYGHAKKIAYKQIIFDKYFNLENNLVWNKIDTQTRIGIEGFRCYAPVTERILFYSNEVGQTGLEAITEEFIKPRNPFAIYLREEFKRSNVTIKEISKLFPSKTGGLTGCVSNWLNGDNVITEDQYLAIRSYLNGEDLRKEYEDLRKEYEDLRKEYEDLRKEYEDLRRPFNNSKYVDVLDFIQETHTTRKYDHPTKKPDGLTRVLIETSTRKGDIAYIPFGGSGTEIAMCASLGIDYIGSEIDEKHYKTIKDRIKEYKGEVGLFA